MLLGVAARLVRVVGVIVLVRQEVAVVVGAGLPRQRARAPLDLDCPPEERRTTTERRRGGGGRGEHGSEDGRRGGKERRREGMEGWRGG